MSILKIHKANSNHSHSNFYNLSFQRQHNNDFFALKGFTGNAEVECVRVPNTCLSNQQCPGGMICPDGICMLACRSDNDCAGNERCSQGM